MNIGTRSVNDPNEIFSNTQFHERLDQLIESNPQKHLPEILEVLQRGIKYISQQDAQSYLLTIKSKLIQDQVDPNDPVVQKINEICQTLVTGKTIEDLPEDVLLYFLKRLDQNEQNKFGKTSQDFQKLQKPLLSASILESEKTKYQEPKKAFISLESKLEMAKQVGEFLTKLNLEDTLITDLQLQEILQACPNIKELNLTNCLLLTNEGLKNLPKKLEVLILDVIEAEESFLTEEGIKNLPPDLRFLSLSHWILTEEGLKNLPEKLETLELTGCVLKDVTLKHLPKDLKNLSLSGCGEWLTDEELKNVPKNLQTLNITSCFQVTQEGIKNNLPKDLKIIKFF